MRILLTSDVYKPTTNGVVTSLVNLQQGLTQLGHEVQILTLSESRRTYYKDGVWYLSSLNSGTIYPGTRVRDTLARKPLKDLISWRPEVVHSQNEFSTFRLARRIAHAVGAPLVHTYHTLYEDYTTYFSPNERMGRVLARLFTRRILAKTDTVIAPTSKIEQLLRSYGVEKPIAVIPSGIDLSRFAPADDKDVNHLREKLGIPKDNQVIVYVGRLAKEKNIDELIANFSETADGKSMMLLVGDGPQRPLLEEQVRSLDLGQRVIFSGMQKQEDIPSFYRLGTVFCSASTSETQGLTYVEALASGIPVLCRADDCLDDLVQDGVNGWQYRTQAEYRQHLERLLADKALQSQLSAEALLSSSRYDRIAFAQSVVAVYESLVSERANLNRISA
ncbi:MAG: glycosyltransferase family 4 protein [Sphaerochaeta sp.]|jgi:1,2-diacylglycerol 3-alpha-glucosyltransferase|uniref:glycosyltransferase family 4 protein n=1 Tax=Sphaerochaeta sp. TaxID=1972642 RepID=UPI002A35E6DE|nr:glycosyltransferase family 4 protein [Sphaerochaeta sp.]MDX9825261.1 glycosyltransferase family 4 protein [Sphaerochaeta sp.]